MDEEKSKKINDENAKNRNQNLQEDIRLLESVPDTKSILDCLTKYSELKKAIDYRITKIINLKLDYSSNKTKTQIELKKETKKLNGLKTQLQELFCQYFNELHKFNK